MDITVIRQPSAPDGTEGALTVINPAGEIFTCETLELPWHDNQSGISCIMADTYNATVWHSDHMNCDVLRLEDKHGRRDCLVHAGNFAGDAAMGFETQVHGCTLVGNGYGSLSNDNGNTQLAILQSKKTLAALLAFIGGGEHTITYTWAEGCEPATV